MKVFLFLLSSLFTGILSFLPPQFEQTDFDFVILEAYQPLTTLEFVPQSQYVIGGMGDTDMYHQTDSICLWDIEAVKWEQTQRIKPRQCINFELERNSPGPAWDISPNGKYLVIRDEHRMSLYTLPDFELEFSQPLVEPTISQSTRWSLDSRFVGTVINIEGIMIWDVETNETSFILFELPPVAMSSTFPSLEPTESGWIAHNFGAAYPTTAFISCDAKTKACETFDFEIPNLQQIHIVASPDGNSVFGYLSLKRLDTQPIVMWQRTSENVYSLISDNFTLERPFCPRLFSHDKYIVSRCTVAGLSEIVAFPEMSSISQLSLFLEPAWFHTQEKFATLHHDITIQIHEIGDKKPLVELDLNTLNNHVSLGISENMDIQMNSDDEFMLVTLYDTAVVFRFTD